MPDNPERTHMKPKVLFVDDEPNILESLRVSLRPKHEAWDMFFAEDGRAALERLTLTPCNVVVSDLRMPGMSGIEFLCQITERTPDISRIILSGYADLDAAIDAVNQGKVFRFLKKPCSIVTLLKAVEDGLEQNRLITSERNLLREISTQRTRLEYILEGTNAGTWEWNVQTGNTVFNERWAELAGYILKELEPTSINTWFNLVHHDDLEESMRMMKEHCEGKTRYYTFDIRMKHKSGDWVWMRDHGRVATWDERGVPLVMYGTRIDITDVKNAEYMMREASIRDQLTGLYNRRYVVGRLEILLDKWSRGTTSGVVSMIDLDNFKAVNDEHGHLAGDEILKGVAHFFAENLRSYDLVARYGGEEFIVIFEDTDRRTVSSIMHKLLVELRKLSWSFNQRMIKVTFSGGIAGTNEFSESNLSLTKLIELADERMYEAKAAGKNRIVTGGF